MKKTANRIISFLLIALLVVGITACNTEGESSQVPGTESGLSPQELSTALKAKHEESEPFDYLDVVEDVKQTDPLRLEVSVNPEDLGLDDLSEFVSIFVDKSLTISLDTKKVYDAEAGEIVVSPPISAPLSPSNETNKWGYAEVYYVAYFYNPVDGSKLEKPAVSPFTIESNLESPYLEFTKSDTGFASFKWTEVPDAEKYHIYAFSAYENLNGGLVWPVGEHITETSFVDEFIDRGGSHVMTNTFLTPTEVGGTSIYRYFYVIAEKNGVYSRASNIIDGEQIRSTLPYFIDTNSEVTMQAMVPSSVSTLPGFVDILMADRETIVSYPVTYHIEDREVVRIGDYINYGDDAAGNRKVMFFTFTVDGTAISDHTYIRDYDYPEFDEELEAMIEKLESTKGRATKRKEAAISRMKNEPPEDSATDRVPQSTDFNVFATTALSEYLGINMLTGVNAIDISDFPEARDSEYLMDAFYEALYQNPLIMTVDSLALSYDNKYLLIEYGQTKEVLLQKQDEVVREVRNVVQNIITDGMTDFEKEMAINDYLCASADYDMDALENALENNMYPDASFNDSFTPYGILINKVGVCASYAASFKLLADEAGLDSIVVTGYLNGNLAHAWNRVNIDGEWMSIDTTNNDNPYLYNYLFNIPDYISGTVLVEDTMYVMDSQLSKYKGTNENIEYYRMSNEYYAPEDIADAIVTELLANGTATLRTDYDLGSADLEAILEQVFMNDRMTSDVLNKIAYLGLYYDLGVISITDQE